MIKVISMLYRNPALSPQEFREYWEKVHVPMVRAASSRPDPLHRRFSGRGQPPLAARLGARLRRDC
jgi:hypothetical protein